MTLTDALAGKHNDELNRHMAAIIPLGRNEQAIVDKDDEQRVLALGKWQVQKGRNQFYAVIVKASDKVKTKISLHRFIISAPPRAIVMHRNGNGLDCRKQNLLIGDTHKNGASHRAKQGETSIFRGVSQKLGRPTSRGRSVKWQAFIVVHGKRFYLGTYREPELAAEAYNQAAMTHFGEHASLNAIP